MKRQKAYTTEDEILYIQSIGEHLQNKKLNKLTILKKYVESLSLRKNWEMIDKKALINFANEYLKKELSHV